MIDITTSCELIIVDVDTGEPVANVQLYGVSTHEMTKVPPAVSPVEVFRRAGIDPDRFMTSVFHVAPARVYRP